MLDEYVEAQEKRMKAHEVFMKTGQGQPDLETSEIGEDNEIQQVC
jgi:hypothetical protein